MIAQHYTSSRGLKIDGILKTDKPLLLIYLTTYKNLTCDISVSFNTVGAKVKIIRRSEFAQIIIRERHFCFKS